MESWASSSKFRSEEAKSFFFSRSVNPLEPVSFKIQFVRTISSYVSSVSNSGILKLKSITWGPGYGSGKLSIILQTIPESVLTSKYTGQACSYLSARLWEVSKITVQRSVSRVKSINNLPFESNAPRTPEKPIPHHVKVDSEPKRTRLGIPMAPPFLEFNLKQSTPSESSVNR